MAQAVFPGVVRTPKARVDGALSKALGSGRLFSQFADFKNSRIFLCSSAVRLARMRMCSMATSHCALL